MAIWPPFEKWWKTLRKNMKCSFDPELPIRQQRRMANRFSCLARFPFTWMPMWCLHCKMRNGNRCPWSNLLSTPRGKRQIQIEMRGSRIAGGGVDQGGVRRGSMITSSSVQHSDSTGCAVNGLQARGRYLYHGGSRRLCGRETRKRLALGSSSGSSITSFEKKENYCTFVLLSSDLLFG
mmetsp:Transcript_23821/g.55564  ORF Transcript_23821/g.55564 Transcript_23821/m.55564 type:complete len:179 (+) Transcript_23821:1842-2378(+)